MKHICSFASDLGRVFQVLLHNMPIHLILHNLVSYKNKSSIGIFIQLIFFPFTGTIHLMHNSFDSCIMDWMRLPTIHDSSSTAQLTNFLRFVHELLHTELQKGAQFTEKGRLDSF